MTTQELKQYIDKVLGNSIRCLLPSYWWKRLFHQVADRIDEVEQSTSELIEASKIPIVESESNLSQLDLPKGSVAAAREGRGSTVKISDCYFSENFEEDWEKYTIVKRVEEKANITIDKVSGVMFSASQKNWLKDAFSVGITADGFGQYVRIIDGNLSETTLSIVNEALSSGKYRATSKSGEPDQYFTFSGISLPELYIKGENSWERLAKESDLEETSSNSLFFYAPTDANTEISDVEKQHNAESYQKVAEGFETDKYYDVKVLMSTSQLVTFDAIQILNPAIDDGKLKLLFRWVSDDREQMIIVTSDGSTTIEAVGTSASGADFTFVAAFDALLNDTTTTLEKSANKTNASLYYQSIQNGIQPKVALKFSFRDSSSDVPVEVVPSFVGMANIYNAKYQSSYGVNAMVFAKLDIGDRIAGLTFDLIMDPDIDSVLVPHIDASEINILHARVLDNAITSDGLSSLALKQNQELYKYALSAPVAVYVSDTRQLIPARVSQGSGFLAVYAGDYVFEFYEDGTIVDHPVQKEETATKAYVDTEIAKKVDKLSIQNVTATTLTGSLQPNTIYNCIDTLTGISINSIISNGEHDEYVIAFRGTTDMPISLPDSVYWANGEIPTIESDTEYELNIVSRTIGAQTFYKAVLVPFKRITA